MCPSFILFHICKHTYTIAGCMHTFIIRQSAKDRNIDIDNNQIQNLIEIKSDSQFGMHIRSKGGNYIVASLHTALSEKMIISIWHC